MAQYNEYKESGQKWLGKVPSHWKVDKISAHFQERKTIVSDIDYKPLSVTKGGVIPQLDSAAKSDNGDNRKLVCKGDFVANSRSDRKGSCGFSDIDGSVSIIYIVAKPIDVNGKFYHYLFRSNDYVEEFYRNGHGIVADLWTTRYAEMKNIQIPIPPADEQAGIVAYLDKVTADIDKAIAAKEQIISALEERRKIIITDAVTRGINPDAPLRDSGIDWLGQIPKHWEVQRFKTLINLINTPSKSLKKIGLENIESHSGKFVASDSVFDGNGIEFNQGDIVYGKLRPYLRKVWIADFDGNAVGDFFVFRSSNKICNEYLQFLMLSDSFTQIVTSATYGAKMPRVSSSTIMNLKIAYPNITEQNTIVSAIKDLTQSIDTAISQQRKAIDLLRERKAIIINEVVTGKVKVV